MQQPVFNPDEWILIFRRRKRRREETEDGEVPFTSAHDAQLLSSSAAAVLCSAEQSPHVDMKLNSCPVDDKAVKEAESKIRDLTDKLAQSVEKEKQLAQELEHVKHRRDQDVQSAVEYERQLHAHERTRWNQEQKEQLFRRKEKKSKQRHVSPKREVTAPTYIPLLHQQRQQQIPSHHPWPLQQQQQLIPIPHAWLSQQQASSRPAVTDSLLIAHEFVPLIVGPNGASLTALEKRARCRITVGERFLKQTRIYLSDGSARDMDYAKRYIKRAIDEEIDRQDKHR